MGWVRARPVGACTLEFAANILVLGKAFFNAMRELVKRAKARARSQRQKPIAVPMAPAHGMMMWADLIERCFGRANAVSSAFLKNVRQNLAFPPWLAGVSSCNRSGI